MGNVFILTRCKIHYCVFYRLADRYGLELVKRTRFEDYIDQEMEEGRELLWRMKALEVST
jgi:hypothetical protein